MSGYIMDKAAMRFAALADYVEHTIACGSNELPSLYPVIWDAVETAVVGSPNHIQGTPFDRSAYLWMEKPGQPCNADVLLRLANEGEGE